MQKSLIAALAVLALLAAAPIAEAQQPLTVGEHVVADFATPNPYPTSGSATPKITWTDEISYPGATYIAVRFSRFDLAPGDKVVVRAPDNSRSFTYTGAGTGDMGLTEGFFAGAISGDRAIVELYSTGNSTAFGYHIDRFGRGYNEADLEGLWAQGLGEKMNLPYPPSLARSICTADDTEEAKCFLAGQPNAEPEAYDKGRAVARLLLNGSAHCTGWLVGSEGHLMTNEHCVTSQSQANQITYEFMAEGATCATNCASSLACAGVAEATSATFIKDSVPLDYALLLPDTSTANSTDLADTYGFFRLRDSGAVLDERIYLVQHPAGWGKRFAMNSTYPDDVAAGGYAYVSSLTEAACDPSSTVPEVGYWADTQGGSSGSPVIGYSDHRVVALHHCRGSAFCTSGNAGSDDRNRGVPIQAVIADLGNDLPAGAVCTPPNAPTNLAATPAGDNQIDLTWTAPATEGATPGADSYNVYRSVGTCPGGAFELIATGVSGTSYSDTTASGNVDYSYKVSAKVDATDCESLESDCVGAQTTGACTLAPAFDGATAATSAGTAQCGITVSWGAGTATCENATEVVYNVYRGTSVDDLEPVATCLTGSTWLDTTATFATEYTYVVRAEDNTGAGSGACAGGNEDTNADAVTAAAGGPDNEVFGDDVESGVGGWTAAPGPNSAGGTTPWSIGTDNSNSPSHSWSVTDQDTVKDEVLVSAPMVLPAGVPTLAFWQVVDTEATYDGGVLEISTDGGTTWVDILDGNPDRFITGGYNATLNTGFSNPLPGRQAWSGNNGGWELVEVDLSDFSAAGTVQLRWRMGCDVSVAGNGWWIDDIRLFAPSVCTTNEVFNDSFESADTSQWSNATGVARAPF